MLFDCNFFLNVLIHFDRNDGIKPKHSFNLLLPIQKDILTQAINQSINRLINLSINEECTKLTDLPSSILFSHMFGMERGGFIVALVYLN